MLVAKIDNAFEFLLLNVIRVFNFNGQDGLVESDNEIDFIFIFPIMDLWKFRTGLKNQIRSQFLVYKVFIILFISASACEVKDEWSACVSPTSEG